MKYASIGSVSSGTLNTEDLLESFASELEYQVKRNASEWCSDEGRKQRDEYMKLIGDANDLEFDDDQDDETAADIVYELQCALEDFAAPYTYFGSNEGDAAAFGYWPITDFDSEDVLRVSDMSEVEDNLTGYHNYIANINDHGNVTFYEVDSTAPDGHRELWSCV